MKKVFLTLGLISSSVYCQGVDECQSCISKINTEHEAYSSEDCMTACGFAGIDEWQGCLDCLSSNCGKYFDNTQFAGNFTDGCNMQCNQCNDTFITAVKNLN